MRILTGLGGLCCLERLAGHARIRTCIACGICLLTSSLTTLADGLDLGGAMNMGSWSPHASRYQIQRPICAWSKTPDQFYRVIAGSAGNFERFYLLGDLGDRVLFDVRWRDRGVSSDWERLLPGLPSSKSYPFASSPGCTGNDTQMQIRLSKGDADKVPGGFYSSALTITLVVE